MDDSGHVFEAGVERAWDGLVDADVVFVDGCAVLGVEVRRQRLGFGQITDDATDSVAVLEELVANMGADIACDACDEDKGSWREDRVFWDCEGSHVVLRCLEKTRR